MLLSASLALDILAAAPELVLHLDFNTIQMKRGTVSEMLKAAAESGYTHVLWEIEDKVRLESCPEAAHPEAFSKAEFKTMLAEAKKLGLKNFPLLQTFGHGEYIMRLEKYRHLREVADSTDCYCISKPETRALVKRMIAECLELFGGKEMEYFHLGGDECYDFGKCPVCAKRNPAELYAEHLNEIAAPIRALGIRPCIWNDMLVRPEWSMNVDLIPKDFVIYHWDYYLGTGHDLYNWRDKLKYLVDHGFTCVFAAASACGGDDPFIADLAFHRKNIDAGRAEVKKYSLHGFCTTSWSVRQALKRLQLPLIRYAGSHKWELGPEYDALSRRDPDLCRFDGRGWHRYKDATVPPPGELGKVLAAVDAAESDVFGGKVAKGEYRKLLIAKAERLRAEIAAALPKVEGDWKRGGELRLKMLDATLSVLRGERPSPLPVAETERYFLTEQPPKSAANSAAIVLGILSAKTPVE